MGKREQGLVPLQGQVPELGPELGQVGLRLGLGLGQAPTPRAPPAAKMHGWCKLCSIRFVCVGGGGALNPGAWVSAVAPLPLGCQA